jgi:hypothetical protein
VPLPPFDVEYLNVEADRAVGGCKRGHNLLHWRCGPGRVNLSSKPICSLQEVGSHAALLEGTHGQDSIPPSPRATPPYLSASEAASWLVRVTA